MTVVREPTTCTKACSPRFRPDTQTDGQTDRRTDRTTTVTLAAHARRGLISIFPIDYFTAVCHKKVHIHLKSKVVFGAEGASSYNRH